MKAFHSDPILETSRNGDVEPSEVEMQIVMVASQRVDVIPFEGANVCGAALDDLL